ncbi:MAG: hypothetical protein OEZ34_14295 [Spirochaetia bacterium]|nr:hypothetical protein [Spirochaetia bacterium]
MNFNQDRYIAIIRGILTMGVVSLLQGWIIQYVWNTYAGVFFKGIFASQISLLTAASVLLIYYVFILDKKAIQNNEESIRLIIDNAVISAVFYGAVFIMKYLAKYLPKLPL